MNEENKTTIWKCHVCRREKTAPELPTAWKETKLGPLCSKCAGQGIVKITRTMGLNRAERVRLRSNKYRNRMAKEQRRQEKREDDGS